MPATYTGLNELLIEQGYRRAATERLRFAKRLKRKAQNRGAKVRCFAERELACALAEAREWGIAGGRS